MTAKLVSSTPELWTPAPDLSWLLKHLHTQHKEASPSLLHSPSDYAFPFSAILGVLRRNPAPRSVYEVPSHTRFIKLVQTPFPLPNQFKPKQQRHTQQDTKFTKNHNSLRVIHSIAPKTDFLDMHNEETTKT